MLNVPSTDQVGELLRSSSPVGEQNPRTLPLACFLSMIRNLSPVVVSFRCGGTSNSARDSGTGGQSAVFCLSLWTCLAKVRLLGRVATAAELPTVLVRSANATRGATVGLATALARTSWREASVLSLSRSESWLCSPLTDTTISVVLLTVAVQGHLVLAFWEQAAKRLFFSTLRMRKVCMSGICSKRPSFLLAGIHFALKGTSMASMRIWNKPDNPSKFNKSKLHHNFQSEIYIWYF